MSVPWYSYTKWTKIFFICPLSFRGESEDYSVGKTELEGVDLLGGFSNSKKRNIQLCLVNFRILILLELSMYKIRKYWWDLYSEDN